MAKSVILANGTFPKKGGAAWRLLESARRVVACDGAADTFIRRFHRAPDFIVGDLDSFSGRGGATPSRPAATARRGAAHPRGEEAVQVYISDQNTNDLTKAIGFCRGKGWKELVIVGATGKREDHALGNIFRAMEAGIEVVSDDGRFIPAAKHLRLRVDKGTPISVFATDPRTRMTSKGLEWPLDGVKFVNLYCATLNRASAKSVSISANLPFFIYIAKGRSDSVATRCNGSPRSGSPP